MFERRLWRDYIENVLVAVLLALFVRTFIWTGYRVPTETMAPTLIPGDYIFAFRLPFGIKLPLTQTKIVVNAPQRGETVVLSFPEEPRVSYVRRVVGMPGDRVEIKQGVLWLNDKATKYTELPKPAGENSRFVVQTESLPEVTHGVRFAQGHQRASMPATVVPPGQVFVLSDNREFSDGLRNFGAVAMERIEGRAQLIWLSVDWSQPWAGGYLPQIRTQRLFQLIK